MVNYHHYSCQFAHWADRAGKIGRDILRFQRMAGWRVDKPGTPPYNKAMYQFLPLGTILQDRYRIVRVLGGGGQGAVYLAEDLQNNKLHVAVKEMRSEAEAAGDEVDPATADEERKQLLDSFNRESEILKTLRHPNMPTFTDAFTLDGRPYLVMEFIPGESFEKKLERRNGQPMPEREALYYAIQIARVLRYLHSQQPPI